MNTMNMPEFTAEASLRKARQHYQSAGFFSKPGKAIHPQWWEWEGGTTGSLDTESPQTYGVVLPGKQDAFGTCVTSCTNAGHTYSDCHRSCCRQFTHYDTCVSA
jgi:hypothetical protein